MWGRRRARPTGLAERPRLLPVNDGGWPERLQFVTIVAVFALCWWTVFHRVEGRVSFAWAGALQQQFQSLTAPLQSRPPAAAGSLVAGRQGPLVAEAVPTSAPEPAATAAPVTPLVLIPAVASPTPVLTAAPSRATAAAATPRATPSRTAQSDLTRGPTATPDAAEAHATATARADLVPAGPHLIYVIQAGDTLYAIARRFGTTPNTLAEFNHLQPPYRLARGGRLLIPQT